MIKSAYFIAMCIACGTGSVLAVAENVSSLYPETLTHLPTDEIDALAVNSHNPSAWNTIEESQLKNESVILQPFKIRESFVQNDMIFNDDRGLSDIQEVTATCREMCCPSWKHYAIFDLLFLQRNNNSLNQPLALDQNTNDVLLSTSGMQSTTAAGVRILYGKYGPNNVGWEIGYLGVYGMFGSQQVTGAENLRAPGDLGNGINSNFNDAELMRSTYSSTLNMAEANLFFYECCGDRNPSSESAWNQRYHCTCIDWIGGLRWAGLNENAALQSNCCDLSESSEYRVRTSSNLFGGQIGLRARKEYQRWAFEGWLKTGLAGVCLSQTQDEIINTMTPGVLLRDGASSNATGLGTFSDMNITAIYKLNQRWGLRAGYNMLWLTGVALAPSQWNFSTPEAVTAINNDGGLFLYGANLGVEARW